MGKLDKFYKVWEEHGFLISFISMIVILCFIGIIRKGKGTWTNHILAPKKFVTDMSMVPYRRDVFRDTSQGSLPSRGPKTSRGEIECRRVLEKIFKKPFVKSRPNFLKNPVGFKDDVNSGSNLELDCYNDELKLAVEYNGVQHYKFTPFFHRNKDAFQNQKYRDHIKRELCKNNGINLIEVPYNIPIDRIENYLTEKLAII